MTVPFPSIWFWHHAAASTLSYGAQVKHVVQELLAQVFEIDPVFYPHLLELGSSDLAHANEFVDGQRLKKGWGLFW